MVHQVVLEHQEQVVLVVALEHLEQVALVEVLEHQEQVVHQVLLVQVALVEVQVQVGYRLIIQGIRVIV